MMHDYAGDASHAPSPGIEELGDADTERSDADSAMEEGASLLAATSEGKFNFFSSGSA